MVLLRRKLKSLLLSLILFLCIFGHCHGSRTTNVFKVKPKYENKGHFFGYLPRRIPIPFSSPSRKHNDIGLQSWRSPWRIRIRIRKQFCAKVTCGFLFELRLENMVVLINSCTLGYEAIVNGPFIVFWSLMRKTTLFCFRWCNGDNIILIQLWYNDLLMYDYSIS